ncbi:MAG: hypothetical protein ACO3XO_09480 [Bdellovibrionota bacterium]|jgi:hypothetical protein
MPEITVRDALQQLGNTPSVLLSSFEGISMVKIHDDETRYANTLLSKKRRNEFLAGRRLIRVALGDIAPVLPSTSRAPQFPRGIYGSLSHSEGYIGFAHAKANPIGLDLQVNRDVSNGFRKRICASKAEEHIEPVRLFSAKEAAYKALMPWHDFIFFPRYIELASGENGCFTVVSVKGEPPKRSVTITQWEEHPPGSAREYIISIAGTPSQ